MLGLVMTCISKTAGVLLAPLAKTLKWFGNQLGEACVRGFEAGLMSLSPPSVGSGVESPPDLMYLNSQDRWNVPLYSDFVLTVGDRDDEGEDLLSNVGDFYQWLGEEGVTDQCFIEVDRLFNILTTVPVWYGIANVLEAADNTAHFFMHGAVVHIRSIDGEQVVLGEKMRNSIKTWSHDPQMLHHYMVSLARGYYTDDPRQIETLARLAVSYSEESR